MDKRGDIPTTLVIPVTLVLIILALFSFLNFNTHIQTGSLEIAQMVDSVQFHEGYVKVLAVSVARETVLSGASDLKSEYQKRIAARDLHLDDAGNFFGKIRTGDFMFEEKEGKVFFEVRGLFVQSTQGANSMKRVFEVKEVFEKAKAVQEEAS